MFKDRIATYTSHHTAAAVRAGRRGAGRADHGQRVRRAQRSVTKINGVTHNPWRHGRTVGGSSGGSAAAVAGGLVSLATGGDGGGSIRIPAGYTGLLGMKGTFGRIPRGPHAYMRPNTVVLGNLARSVRDAARYYDVCAGLDPYDPTSLPVAPAAGRPASAPTTSGAGGSAIVPALGGVTLEPGVEDRIRAEAEALIADTGMVEVDLEVDPPNLAAQWMMGNLATLLADLGDRWPALRRRPHRRGRDRAAPVAVALQPPHRGGGRGAADPGQRGDGRGVRPGRLHHRRHQPRPGVPGRRPRRAAREESFLDWAKASDAARYAFRGVLFGARRRRQRRAPEAAVGAARPGQPSGSPTS